MTVPQPEQTGPEKTRSPRPAIVIGAAAAMFGLGLAAPAMLRAPADAAPRPVALPKPPADGIMGFVVQDFSLPIIRDKNACPDGLVPTIRQAYLKAQPEAERVRLEKKENEAELTQRWKATVFGPDGTNICSQPDLFERATFPEVKSRHAWGLDLDGGSTEDGCAHDTFETPTGLKGIDNQEYRALGCSPQARAADGSDGEQTAGFNQFLASGEWTQVILLRGVDSLQNDDDVEVIYGNTADRPMADSKGRFLPGASFTISDSGPRHRNALKGKIVNGVLTTEPMDISLTQTWGQGGVREIRGARYKYLFQKGRLRLEFQPDGTLRGFLGGYRPLIDLLSAETLGGAGSATTAGIDCAAKLATARKLADGIRDPKTGKCTAISSAYRIGAIPAFVNDVPTHRSAAR